MDAIAPADARGDRRRAALGLGLLAALALGAWIDRSTGWVAPAFDFVAHQFYEVPVLARLRRPAQLPLVRMHLAVGLGLAALGLLVSGRLDRHARGWWWVFVGAYAIRAAAWTAGGNLPLVPGDSCHYVEVATSIARGEGPVKHYVDSFSIDYPPIRLGQPVLDDWATPLYPYVLAGAYRALGVVPGADLEATLAVAKGVSFVANLLTLPALYLVARRRFGREVALGAMAVAAVLPVHAIYAGFELRESLVALTSVLAVGALLEVWDDRNRHPWRWAVAAGVLGGLAILARHTTLALMTAGGLYGLVAHGRRRWGPSVAWGAVLLVVITPWAVATTRAYGEPFYTVTKHFQYTFSWTVHHYARGFAKASDFYTRANAPEIARVKLKSLGIVAGYSTMILGLPTVLGFFGRLRSPAPEAPARDYDGLVAWLALGFVAATLANIADVTQVAQLGRYYLPLYLLMLPTAAAGVVDFARAATIPKGGRVALASAFVALVWADPTWAYDASWLVKPYQLHWPALREAGTWIKGHPEAVPPDARIMTWFPWEVRLATDRTTILLPRSLVLSRYEIDRIDETIRQYGVTHVLWGSFDPQPNADAEALGPQLDRLRISSGLVDRLEVWRSSPTLPFPVRLYRLRGGSR